MKLEAKARLLVANSDDAGDVEQAQKLIHARLQDIVSAIQDIGVATGSKGDPIVHELEARLAGFMREIRSKGPELLKIARANLEN